MENEIQQLKYPLDYVSRQIIEAIILDMFKAGSVLPKYTTTDRDNFFPPQGTIIYNITTDKLNFYTGSAWEAITSA